MLNTSGEVALTSKIVHLALWGNRMAATSFWTDKLDRLMSCRRGGRYRFLLQLHFRAEGLHTRGRGAHRLETE